MTSDIRIKLRHGRRRIEHLRRTACHPGRPIARSELRHIAPYGRHVVRIWRCACGKYLGERYIRIAARSAADSTTTPQEAKTR